LLDIEQRARTLGGELVEGEVLWLPDGEHQSLDP
jgi:hypothetical protein